jgi:hypothetical protein
MANYNAADIIDKTLVAKKTTNIVRIANDKAPTVYQVQPGSTIGTVYSYLLPNANRDGLYWQFYDQDNKPYYVKHKIGQFDISTIKSEGALTLEEKEEKAAAASETTKDKIFKYIKNGFYLAAAVYLTKTFIDTKKK